MSMFGTVTFKCRRRLALHYLKAAMRHIPSTQQPASTGTAFIEEVVHLTNTTRCNKPFFLIVVSSRGPWGNNLGI